jgi:hypothetical protein
LRHKPHPRPVRQDILAAKPATIAGSAYATILCLQGGGIGMHVLAVENTAEAQAVAAGFDCLRGGVGVHRDLPRADGAASRPQNRGGNVAPLRTLAVHGMLLGHSLLGQHASDVSMVINWVLGREFGYPAEPGGSVIGHDPARRRGCWRQRRARIAVSPRRPPLLPRRGKARSHPRDDVRACCAG